MLCWDVCSTCKGKGWIRECCYECDREYDEDSPCWRCKGIGVENLGSREWLSLPEGERHRRTMEAHRAGVNGFFERSALMQQLKAQMNPA